jgi:hypothetical protein
MSYTLVETCCASSAFTLYLLGARKSLMPYQGSKWKLRRPLAQQAERLGFSGPPSHVVLTDPGPWGGAIGVVLDREKRAQLIDRLRWLETFDPFRVYASFHGAPVPEDDEVTFATQFLFLQRLAFSGKAVGIKNERWSSPGFNKTNAYGTPETDRFGAVQPMIPSLIRTLESYAGLVEVDVTSSRASARPLTHVTGPTLVYIDPPYDKATGYPNGTMGRAEVVSLAQACQEVGAAVMISEQCGLDIPGWNRVELTPEKGHDSSFRGKQAEWLTCTMSWA